MKKSILIIALLMFLNINYYALSTCAEDAVVTLNTCLVEKHLNVMIDINDGTVYIYALGNISAGSVRSCMGQYNGNASHCADAPTVVYVPYNNVAPTHVP